MRDRVQNLSFYKVLVCCILFVLTTCMGVDLYAAEILDLEYSSGTNVKYGSAYTSYNHYSHSGFMGWKFYDNDYVIEYDGTIVVVQGDLTIDEYTTLTVTDNAILIVEGNLILNGEIHVKNDASVTIKKEVGGKNGTVNLHDGYGGTGYFTSFGGFASDAKLKFVGYNENGELFIENGELVAKDRRGNVINQISISDETSTAYLTSQSNMAKASEMGLLPIELTYFSVSENGGVVDFAWETSSEYNNDFYTIEYSRDGSSWSALLEEDGAGTTSDVSSYVASASAQQFSGLTYFRLKQTDFNGEYSYSDVTTVAFAEEQDYYVYPNPAEDVMTIGGAFESARIIDIHQRTVLVPTEAEVTVSGLPAGVYHVVLTTENGKKVIPFIKK